MVPCANLTPLLRFLLVLTAILGGLYAYLASRLAPSLAPKLALAAPFVLIWLVPAVYWVGDRDRNTGADELLHFASYLSMGWLNFALLFTLARDALLLVAGTLPALAELERFLAASGEPVVLAGSAAALAVGILSAMRGPRLREIEVAVPDLHPALEGLRIAQISDLHVGPTIGGAYVRRVVRMANRLGADLVAVTGDVVDGPVSRLEKQVAPLAELSPPGRVFLVLGNHEYYSGAPQWIERFRAMGLRVLLNEHALVSVRGASVIVGGVLDPAGGAPGTERGPRPELAAGREEAAAFRLLLAHNPKSAPLAEAAGFDLQLSGHTHAGQFFPWTLAVRLVHSPHVAGLSRQGRMWVYVSAGTGSWGPPVRFGSEPELALIRLVRQARP